MKKIEIDGDERAVIFCSECHDELKELIEYEDDSLDSSLWLCEDCLKEGLEMLK